MNQTTYLIWSNEHSATDVVPSVSSMVELKRSLVGVSIELALFTVDYSLVQVIFLGEDNGLGKKRSLIKTNIWKVWQKFILFLWNWNIAHKYIYSIQLVYSKTSSYHLGKYKTRIVCSYKMMNYRIPFFASWMAKSNQTKIYRFIYQQKQNKREWTSSWRLSSQLQTPAKLICCVSHWNRSYYRCILVYDH